MTSSPPLAYTPGVHVVVETASFIAAAKSAGLSGADVDGIGTTTVRVRSPQVGKDEPDATLVGRLRGSVLLLGPLLARRGRARLAPPGGDFPARRTISTHLACVFSAGMP